tara:strand:+ start:944 stop:1399 length:456 start_codon:yes stop_codon:yes gene_type:complete
MSSNITCHTLFDITRTGVINRAKPGIDDDAETWFRNRNTQCNLDTILQVISLRSQPELLTDPEKVEVILHEDSFFGSSFSDFSDPIPCWKFDFNVQHSSVFDDGQTELGMLYSDCDRVPMVLCSTEWNKLPPHLDSSPQFKNIHFTINYDQ